VWLVNDTTVPLEGVEVTWSVSDDAAACLARGATTVGCEADARVRVAPLELRRVDGRRLDVRLSATGPDGRLLARNRYDALFDHPPHVAGHPHRMSHELGMRVYFADSGGPDQ
jgi:beta-mannosidase